MSTLPADSVFRSVALALISAACFLDRKLSGDDGFWQP